MIMSKTDTFGFLANMQELYERLSAEGGKLEHVDETHREKGKLVLYFQDELGAEKAFNYAGTDPFLRHHVSVFQV